MGQVVLCILVGLLSILSEKGVFGNDPPVFTQDLANHIISEATEVGTVVGKLEGYDPEGSVVHFSISGTDRLQVDRDTGDVTLVKPLDHEEKETLEFSVGIEDVVDPNVHSGTNNLVKVPVTFIILDENDNAPSFKNTPYTASVPEDTDVGTTIFHNIVVEDDDLSGDTLEVSCSEDPQFPNTCAKFDVQAWNANQSSYLGGVVLKQPVDYSERPFFRVLLSATDGQHTVTTGLEVKVQDIQNTPPVFQGSLTGVIQEDDPIGTLVMTVQARDGDKGQPRKINYQLLTNPLDYFLLDSETGELRTAKPLDREALKDSTGVISLTIIAREIVNGVPSEELMTSTTAVASVTIKDVNDEPPTFNEREYTVSLPENIPDGTPIPNLDMTVTDPDIGANSAFSLRLSDLSGAFSVEPTSATGSTSVSIRVVNGSLDYENPNTRKFIILVIAEETETNPKLSSTATVTVQITDENDNPPQFDQEVLSATVSETASPGHVIANFTAMDRDSGRYGADGIVYELIGDGAEKFQVNRKTGVITVAQCDKPGAPQCLDFETKPVYFLSYQAKDDEGQGLSSVVPLKISLFDSNDNPPEFTSKSYSAVIDEGASKFEPPLQVQAKDADKTTELEYSIIDGNEGNLFTVDSHTGEIMVADPMGLDMSNVSSDYVHLVIQAGDGIFTAKTLVNITVLDVNNNHPVFERESYVATVKEDSPIGTTVEKVSAEDADSGINANLVYRIEKGAFDDFAIDNMTGVITVASKLDYDLRTFYAIQVIAVDGGTPALTGTTTVSLNIENSNDKAPFFAPPTQRAEVGEDAEVGSVIYKLIAKDLDVNSSDALNYFASEPITAVDKNGKEVVGDTSFKDFFTIDQMTGKVIVAKTLQRDVASVVRITVIVSDITAPKLQQGKGTLVVTIIDVNDFPPVFTPPWSPLQPYYSVDLLEEQPVGTLVGTFTATDPDSNIANYVLEPESEYFEVQNTTGAVRTIHRIDYEETPKLNFTIVAYDSGVPQFSASAVVFVNVININDIDPVFNQSSYSATIQENAPQGTIVARVKAVDKDSGVFGKVTYSLIGEHSSEFNIDYETGEISVAKSTALDRENREEIILQVMASDGAPPETRRIISVPVTIKLLDVNDNSPTFTQHNYIASIVENIPPSPIVQLRAQDKDLTSELHYKIVSGNDGDVFKLDPVTGILTPAVPLIGKSPHYTLNVEVSDGTFTDTANVDITILDVNQHSPVFITPTPSQNATIHISENDVADMLVMTVQAFDNDSGKNGHVTYHFKVNNSNVQETEEFSIDPESGELRAKIILDRETRPSYQLVLVARDQATPTWHEALQFLTIVLKDVDDNFPEFPAESNSTYIFKVMENTPARRKIGKVEAKDIDEGENSKVYYYIISGNEERKFSVDRLDGIIMTNGSLDRETQNFYELFIKATNDPDYYTAKDKDATKTVKESSSVARVQIIILDENDNPPVFERITYYAGVNALANPGQLIAEVIATDLDAGENGSITYQVVESHLFKAGSNVSSGSVVPSPFNITNNGRLKTATLVAEYNQVRFRLDVVARETAHPHREARATVHVWIYEDQQLIRVILSRPPEEVNQERDKIIHELSNATQSLVIVDEIRYHTDASGHKQLDWCDMFLHVVDNQTLAITSIPEVLKVIDAQYDFLKDYYAGFAIENVIPAHVGKREETFEPALAALIALLVVLFVGCVSVIVVCCCFRHWVVAEPIDMKSSDTLIKKAILDDLNTTENPLWIEQKLKLYEEQELTMQVFCEPESGTQIPTQATMERRDSGDMSVVDNTYDTIQHPARRGSMNTVLSLGAGDYATLGGSLLPLDNVSSHSQQMYEAALGFQGSTFQVPESGDLFRPRSELRVNKDGQPEFVSELI